MEILLQALALHGVLGYRRGEGSEICIRRSRAEISRARNASHNGAHVQ